MIEETESDKTLRELEEAKRALVNALLETNLGKLLVYIVERLSLFLK